VQLGLLCVQNAGVIIGKAGSNMKRLRNAVSYFYESSPELSLFTQNINVMY